MVYADTMEYWWFCPTVSQQKYVVTRT